MWYNTRLDKTDIYDQAPVVQKVDNAMQLINLYPMDNAIGFPTVLLSQ